jgi:hypothetical protein
MSELWKTPHRDESPDSAPGGMDRTELRATLTDLARAAERETQPPGADPVAGAAGHQALAALAARAARVTEESSGPAIDSAPAPHIAPPARFAPTPVVPSAGVSQPAAGPSSPPAGDALQRRPSSDKPAVLAPTGRPAANGTPVALTGPATSPAAGATRLPGSKASAAVPAALEQPTIALRRRPITSAPAPASTAAPAPSSDAAPASTPAPRPVVNVTAWLPSDDDILPPRQIRRRSSWRRAR